jgi:hypothetical protein
MMRTATRSGLMLAAIVLLASGCEFFNNNQDGAEFGTDDASDTETTGDDQPPQQGFRVFPKFMLQDVPAIVTMDVDGVSSTACPLDGAGEGGYICDADELTPGSLTTVRIERDGFEAATRQPEVPFNQIMPLEVHLAVEGGPTGAWSPCASATDFETCDDLCATFVGTCAVTSCATEQPEWPIATVETFADAECSVLVESLTLACDDLLPNAGSNVALRCCCAS